MARFRYSTGVLIIILGILILLGKTGIYQTMAGLFWPIFVLAPALLLHYLYFSKHAPASVLIPGGILGVYALMFFFCSFFGWNHMAWLWPGFILGVAVGFYEHHLFEAFHAKSSLLIAVILAGISAVFFAFSILISSGVYLIAIALILIGGFIILRPKLQ